MRLRNKALVAAAVAAAFGLATALAAAQDHETAPAPATSEAHAAQTGEPEGAPALAHTEGAGTGHPGDEQGAAHEGAHEAEHGPAPLNFADVFDKKRPALIAILINFGLLVGLYYALGRKSIAEGLRQRRVTIGKDIEDAQRMLKEAQERAKKYQGDLKNADVDAATAKTALIAAGKGEVERALADAEEKAERMKRDAERLVEQERKQLHEDLHRETVDMAVDHAEKLLERSVTAEDHQRFAQDLLNELAAVPRGAA